LTELPEYPSVESCWLPARGRRLLAFSDSRQEAARLGPRLTKQHELQLFRAIIAKTISDEPVVDADTLAYLRGELRTVEDTLQKDQIPSTVREKLLRRREEISSELQADLVGGSIPEWARKIGQRPLVKELLDVEYAQKHRSHDWG